MPRMIDLVRASALPAALVQSMAKGAIALPPREVVEILVHLATHNPAVKEQARKTLESWNPTQLQAIIADARAPREVVEYFRPTPTAHASAGRGSKTTESKAETAQAEMKEPEIGEVEITEEETAEETAGEIPAADEISVEAPATVEAQKFAEAQEFAVEAGNDSWSAEDEAGLNAYLKQHEEELKMEGEQPFQPLGGFFEEELIAEAQPQAMAAAAGAGAGQATASSPAAHGKPLSAKKGGGSPEQERGSVLQKISRLDVKGRIQLALKGTKEERSILIRDSAKLVCLAVLESPKITDGEVEKFASQKNVLEAVLRQIPLKRRFAKNYIIVRNLVFNPRTPLDISLGLMKNLLVTDLKNLSSNKEVSDTIRKLGLKMYKQKLNPGKS